MKSLSLSCVLIPVSVLLASYNPLVDGALSEVCVKVVDDRGAAVPGASVKVSYQVSDYNGVSKDGTTDDRGVFVSKGRNIGSVWIYALKDGYYDARLHPDLREQSTAEAQQSGAWTRGVREVVLTLRRKFAPVKLVRKGGTYSNVKYPVLDEAKGFDLELFDWCPPHGNGRYADFTVKTEYWRSSDDWLKVYDKTVVSMTNCVDGFYLADVHPTSAFRYDYAANTNAVFSKELVFEYDRRTGKVEVDRKLPEGKYLVVRTRTRLDGKGNLVSARYGLIRESFNPVSDLDVEYWYNPVDNEVSLEGDWRHVLPPPRAEVEQGRRRR